MLPIPAPNPPAASGAQRARARSLRLAIGALAAATALVGVLHAPFARPLLTWLGGCPFGAASPAQIERAQRSALEVLRGSEAAPERPALGFSLDRDTASGVKAWAAAHHLGCEELREGTLLKCSGVPVSALPDAAGAPGTIDEVAFEFELGGRRVVNVTTLRTHLSAGEASRIFRSIAAALADRLGSASQERRGEADAEWTGVAPVLVKYRFSDYVAEASAMDLPGRGVAVREHYLSALDWAADL